MKELRWRPLQAPKDVSQFVLITSSFEKYAKHAGLRLWVWCPHFRVIYLDVAVDVEPVVLAGEHDAAILHERHVEALRMFHLALQSS